MDEYEIEEKAEELKRLQTKQDAIRLENSLLSEHLSRIVTRKGSLQLHLENLEEQEKEKEEPEKEKEEEETPKTLRKPSRKSVRIFAEGPPTPKPSVRFSEPHEEQVKKKKKEQAIPMSTEEKVEIAEEECNSLNDQVEKIRAENDRSLDDLRTVFNEFTRSMKETKKEKNSFHREVVLLSEINPRKIVYTEDILRYLNEKLRKKTHLRDKIQEKNDLLHMEIMEAEHQFSTKKHLKDILHAIDFDQMSIQNVQLHARIQDKMNEVWDLKRSIKHTLKALEIARRRLGNAVDKGISFKKYLNDRRPVLKSLVDCIAQENARKKKLRGAVINQMQVEDGPPRPHALDYMRSRSQNQELLKELKTWTSKVEVAELTHNQLMKMMKQSPARKIIYQPESSAVLVS